MKLRLPKNRDEKLKVYQDYATKLEYLFGIRVFAFDPDFAITTTENSSDSDRITFYFAHLILKSHNLHNENIEVYE